MTSPHVTEAPSESLGTVQEGLDLIKAWDDGGAPSQSWPSTVQMMHEISLATDEQHGGPLETPTLAEVRPATWDEIRARIEAEKAAAAAPAPVVPPAPEEPSAALTEPEKAPTAAEVRQARQNDRTAARRATKRSPK